ncbi:MAG: hypothetical protein WDW38_006372 [Sanguina aurantia]
MVDRKHEAWAYKTSTYTSHGMPPTTLPIKGKLMLNDTIDELVRSYHKDGVALLSPSPPPPDNPDEPLQQEVIVLQATATAAGRVTRPQVATAAPTPALGSGHSHSHRQGSAATMLNPDNRRFPMGLNTGRSCAKPTHRHRATPATTFTPPKKPSR